MATGGEGYAAVTGGRRRVLVFPLPFQGHINPMFHLAGVLHARGFAVTVFHLHLNAPDPSRHPAFDFVPVPDGILRGGDDHDDSGDVRATVARILDLNRACEAPFRERLAALLAAGPGGDVACLVADSHLLTLMDVARSLGVPTLALRTGSAASFRIFAAFPMLCDKGYLPARESELDAPVLELPPYRVRDVVIVGLDGRGHDLVAELMSRAVEAVRTSTGLILNTLDALETPELAALRRDLDIPVFDVGPLHKLSPPAPSSSLLMQDRGCLEWLDAQAPASVVYVSFGSLASMSAAELVEAAWGIANSGHPFLWVLRPGLVRGGGTTQQVALPDGFDAATRGRGAVVSWAPQEEVLTHPAVGGFWTHAGWNSTLESVCAGVPMLCRPCFADQRGNARYVEHVWQAGITLDGSKLERGEVEAAIRRLMEGVDSAGMRRRAGELKSRAAECVTMAGSSCLNIDKLINHILSL